MEPAGQNVATHFEADALKTARLKVATFNMQCARRPEAIARAINGNDNLRSADIMLVQEIESHRHEPQCRARAIARACGFDCHYMPAREEGDGGTHGLAVMTRHRLESVTEIPLSFCKLGFNSRRRIAVGCRLHVNGTTVRIYNVHLDTRINASTRIEQMSPVLEEIAGNPGERAVLAGDFNTLPVRWVRGIVPIWYENQRHAVDSVLARHGFTERIETNGYTMRSGPVRFRLDSIYSKGLSIVSSGVERDVRVSDHAPLWAEMTL